MEAGLQHDQTAWIAGKNRTFGIRSAISRTAIVCLTWYKKIWGISLAKN
jgi:hypothetical protein